VAALDVGRLASIEAGLKAAAAARIASEAGPKQVLAGLRNEAL
jgi:hypothetical protein